MVFPRVGIEAASRGREHFKLATGLPLALTDRVQLQQIFANLAVNAISGDGGNE